MSEIHAEGEWDRYLDGLTEAEQKTESTLFYGMENEMFVITRITESNGQPGAMETISMTFDEARQLSNFVLRWFSEC